MHCNSRHSSRHPAGGVPSSAVKNPHRPLATVNRTDGYKGLQLVLFIERQAKLKRRSAAPIEVSNSSCRSRCTHYKATFEDNVIA